jgi:hypothetical protein
MCTYHDTPNTADANDAVATLRSIDFDDRTLPACGHVLKTIPAEFYHAERVTKPMW